MGRPRRSASCCRFSPAARNRRRSPSHVICPARTLFFTDSVAKAYDGRPALDELRAISPVAVGRVGERDPSGIARILRVFGHARLLCGGFGSEGEKGRAAHQCTRRLTVAGRRAPARHQAPPAEPVTGVARQTVLWPVTTFPAPPATGTPGSRGR